MHLAFALAALCLQETDLEKLAHRCDSQIEWLSDGATVGDNDQGRNPGKVDTMAVFEKAKAAAKEQKRLILWYVPRMWGTHMYRPALPDGYVRIGLFTHPEVAALVTRKFVAMRCIADRALGEATGVKRFDYVEPAIAILTPDGKVVHVIDRIRTFNADWLIETLVAVLRKNSDYNGSPKEATNEERILAGDYGRLIEDEPDLYHRAMIARRQRNGEAALKNLQGMDSPDARVERGRIFLGQAKFAEAKAEFEAGAKGKRSQEAAYYSGLCDFWLGDTKKAEEQWTKLVGAAPDSPWAWRAAANLVADQDTMGKGPALHAFEDVAWPPDAACGLVKGTRFPRDKKEIPDVARRGVEFLLRAQRTNGGWEDSRYCYWPDQKILPNVWIAVSAASAAALLDWRDVAPERIDAAIARAEKYFLDESRMARGVNEEIYADAFKILYLVRKQQFKADPKNLELMAGIARRLAGTQDQRGFWAHEYPNPFATAAVVNALARAKEAGAKIDEGMIKRAGEGLLSTRGKNGEQAYDSERRPSSMKDSSARVVQCEHALLLAGKTADLAKAFENYWKYYDKLNAVRVCDFHSDGELAGFFLYHSVFFTSEAVRGLPEKSRREQYDRLLAWVLTLPEMDGSFLDSHELGKSYGTAMALRAIRTCSK